LSSHVDPRASHPDAPAGKADKYALVERERRFLLAASPVGIPIRRWLIEDRYLRGTRIRLRRMTDLDEAAGVTYKLTQKIPTAGGRPGLITTMYLSAAEYAVLVTVPADTLRKIRSSFPPLGVDMFEGPLRGLVLAEAEFENAADEARFRPPVPVVGEVTMDPRFAGGFLVTLSAHEVTDLLVEFAIDR
jgi:CYTH domain-containing protein